MQSPGVKQIAVKMVADVYSTVIIKVFYNLFKHHAEKDAEQSQCQNITLFHAVDDREGSREVTVQPILAAQVFVELDNHNEELWGAAKALHDHPQSLSAHCVKRFGQVHKRYQHSFVLHPAFLLELSKNMSVVPLLALNPHWVSGRWSSAMLGTNLFRNTRARIFPAMESRVIPR